MMRWRRLHLLFFLIFATSFIFFVSFKILEPELEDLKQNHGSNDINNGGEIEDFDKNVIREVTEAAGPRKKGHKTPSEHEQKVKTYLSRYDVDWSYQLKSSPWTIAAGWVKSREIHPEETPEMGAILREMSKRRILMADVGYRGTQLKLSLILAGGQRVAFKPKWYDRNYVVTGKPYSGADRHNGEITSFHLNRILGFRRSPLVVGRVIDLKKEILPVAEERLFKTFFKKGNNTCFYGQCHYCKSEEDGVCARGTKIEGAVVLWLPKEWRFQLWKHPWSRTYNSRRAKWETDEDYCLNVKAKPLFSTGPRLLDIMDACVFDYLIGNADRHHYETFRDRRDSMLVMLDSAKSFGNPHHDEKTILAPLYQCCKLRISTWLKLKDLQHGVLTSVLRIILSRDPLSPLLSELHFKAMDRRLGHIIETVLECIEKYSEELVLVTEDTQDAL